MPADPSTRTRSPVRTVRVPLRVLTTHGMPSSRATTAAWLSAPPMSTTSADETNMIDAQLGSVVGVDEDLAGLDLGERRVGDDAGTCPRRRRR